MTAAELKPTHDEKQAAAHVLWYFGAGGYEPGSFTARLLAAFARADVVNLGKLSAVFPELGEAYRLAAHHEGGLDALRNRLTS